MLEMLMAMERTKKRSRTTRSTIMDCLLGVYLNVSCEEQPAAREITIDPYSTIPAYIYVLRHAVCEGATRRLSVCGARAQLSVVVNLRCEEQQRSVPSGAGRPEIRDHIGGINSMDQIASPFRFAD